MNQDTTPMLVRLAERCADLRHGAFVPVDDQALHRLVCGEIARAALAAGPEELIVIVDQETSARIDAVEVVRLAARKIYHVGTVPPSWTRAGNVVELPIGGLFSENDRFLFIVSPWGAFAALGTRQPGEDEDLAIFEGAWTSHRPTVVNLASALPGIDLPEVSRRPGPDGEGEATSVALRLMAVHSNYLGSRQRDISMDKDDLFSVLNILKAMSAKRSAHDILYVFVEHIARVVTSDRCSVVRVWGGETCGHVLASHEDVSLSDRTIDLDKYPELGYVLQSGEKVIINDVRDHPLLRCCLDELERARIRSLLVIPIVLFDKNVGSLLLRAARANGTFTLREISFFEIVAEAASNALERAELFERIQQANERLELLAITDGLTGLYNHRCFQQRLHEEVERALRYRIPLSCMIFDVDNFKLFNDTYGHLTGDGILSEIAKRTTRSVRRSDIVARYGGEEFVVIMPQTAAEGASAQAERVREEIAAHPFPVNHDGVSVTVSVGVAVLDHERNMDSEGLILNADRALYEAKRTGKNKVVLAS